MLVVVLMRSVFTDSGCCSPIAVVNNGEYFSADGVSGETGGGEDNKYVDVGRWRCS